MDRARQVTIRRRASAVVAALAVVLTVVGGLLVPAAPAAAATPASTPTAGPVVPVPVLPFPLRPPNRRDHRLERTCATAMRPGVATCNAVRQTDQDAPIAVPATSVPGAVPGSAPSVPATGLAAPAPGTTPSASTVVVPAGYAPGDLRSAYGLSSAGGAGATVAIVDAYDDPTAESDLATYRSTYGLPACTSATGCFRKVNQSGAASPLPPVDAGWAGEISLDLDAVSAICPNCRILLVEASSTSLVNLGLAVNAAVAGGARFVSNSYGASESGSEASYDSRYFSHPGVVITASSGDAGYGTAYPASGSGVIAVGGTSLSPASGTPRGWSETAWSSAGSGCSRSVARPAVQASLSTGCARRAEADVSAVADPQTGIAVYQTTGGSGWQVYGGTSVASPVIAGIAALAGTPGASDATAAYPYAHRTALNDVTSGSNGTCGAPLCTAGAGYDGPTGLGTPIGTAALTPPPDPIVVKYTALGGPSSFLGAPSGAEYAIGSGRAQNYANGRIYWSAASGAWEVHGAILSDYLALGGPTGAFGFPTTDESGTPDGVGRFNHFTGAAGAGVASVYWTPAQGPHGVRGAIRARWASMGYERGYLGYPTSEQYAVSGGARSNFVGGAIVAYTNGAVVATR